MSQGSYAWVVDGDSVMAKQRILVVEDEPLVAKGIKRLLDRFGYDVIGPISSGEDAVRHAQDFAPDLTLMDITLKGSMDGIETAERIRSLGDLPIVYLTAKSDHRTLERAKVTEPHGYLLKPFSDRDLFVTVETALYKAAMENRLKESEQRYRTLFEHCPVALFELDVSETKKHLTHIRHTGETDIADYLRKNPHELALCIEKAKVIGVNQAALDLFETPDASAFERDLTRFFDPKSTQWASECVHAIGQGLPDCQGSADLVTLSGKEISAVWTSSLLESQRDGVSRVSLCLLDITETRRAQEALKSAHQDLEIRVEERTADLCRAVAQLHREMAIREQIGKSLQQRVDELGAINRVSRSMNSSLLPAQVLKCAHDEIVAALKPDTVVVYLNAGDRLLLENIGSVQFTSIPNAPEEKPVGECLCGLAVKERQSQYGLNIHIDPRCTLPECKQAGMRSVVTLPLLVGDQAIGVIGLGSSQERDFRQHAAFLETMASHLAVALQNARLHQQVNTAKAELEQRVAERTIELARSNESLHKEVAERKLVEEALRQREAKYRAIFDNAAIGITLVDSDGRLLETNAALYRMLGYDAAELEGVTVFDITHPDDVSISNDRHRGLLSGEYSSYRLEKRYVRKDGEMVWADLSASVIRDPAGKYLATVGVIMDITDRKRYEQNQTQLVEEIRNFAYIVSHDLRSPLVNLRGFSRELTTALHTIEPAVQLGMAHLPQQTLPAVREALEEDIPECLSFIGSSISHMNNQVNGILKLSRLGHSDLYFESLSMNELVEQVLAMFAYEINQRSIAVSVEELPDIVADRTSMEQILTNLIGNAMKYLAPHRAGRIAIRGERLIEETRFEIRDNGRGIRQEDLSRIFDIFQRAGNTDVPGEGLGLSCVRTLVRRLGGRTWCESLPDVGSTFFFTIAHREGISSQAGKPGRASRVR